MNSSLRSADHSRPSCVRLFRSFLSSIQHLLCLVAALFPAVSALADRELHVVGVYEGTAGGTSGRVAVNRAGQSVTLFLSSYDTIDWQVTVGAGTTIERVFLSGYYTQSVQGIPAGVPVIRKILTEGSPYLFVGYDVNSSRFLRSVPKINEMTGQEIASFHGSYQATADPFVIDSVQNNPLLSAAYPQPVPLDSLPDVHYQLAIYGGGLTLHDYTLAGPPTGQPVIPEGLRVSADAARQFYWGGEDGLVAVNAATGTSQAIPLPPDVEREGWQVGTGFDLLRNRALVVTLSGEGFTYAYSPATQQWTTAFSMHNRDFDCLEYRLVDDTLWGVTTSHEDSVYAKVIGLNAADGTLAKEITLPIFPFDIGFGGHRSELVAAGDYLVLLLQPNSPFYYPGDGLPESRIYLIDPRTSQVWLTYRRTGPPNRPPTVAITSPTNGQSVVAGSTLRIVAAANDSDGSISTVEFKVDDASIGLGTRSGGTFVREWTVPSSGEHAITAIATDDRGATATSAPVTIRVNQVPVVHLTSPADGSTFQRLADVELIATADDPNDSILSVDFLVDGTSIGLGANVPGTNRYSLHWSPRVSGDHTIKARAIDTNRAVSFSESITVHVVSQNPTVHITSPVNGSSFVQFTVVDLVAEAESSTDSVASVEFFVDAASIGTAARVAGTNQYTLRWTARDLGPHLIKARATDTLGAFSFSDPIGVTVTGEASRARRLLPAEYRPGRKLRVGILVQPGRGTTSYTVTERPPAGWTVSEISDGGTYDSTSRTLNFGPIAGDRVKLLSYSVTPADDAKGTQAFSGQLVADGVSTSITGQQSINGPNAKRHPHWRVTVK